jgi:hypothetical protein
MNEKNAYSCMSLYMRWPLRNFYTFHHLVDSYRNTISEWALGFCYGNFTLKLASGKKSLASRGPTALARGLIFGGEEISIPETRPIQKYYNSGLASEMGQIKKIKAHYHTS